MRHAGFYPNSFEVIIRERETSLAVNWFFKNHDNKLTLEVSNFEYEGLAMESLEEWRLRVQWDISF